MLTTLLAAAILGQNVVIHRDVPQRIHRVAIIPFVYRGGTQTAVDTARDTVDKFFDRAGYDRLSTNRIESVWAPNTVLFGDENAYMPRLPSEQAMRRIGRELNADLVVAGEVRWHTRPIWVSLGPKTKSTAYVSIRMVALGDHPPITLNVHEVEGNDTEEESGFKTAAGILTGGLVTVVSGGPETPHEQRAVQIALSRAFEPWLEGAIPE